MSDKKCTGILLVSGDTETNIDKADLIKRVKRSIYYKHYVNLKVDFGLLDLGIDPQTIRRKGGKPPAHMLQKSSISGCMIPIYEDRDIVQLVLNQKWHGGKIFTNINNVEFNPCFYSVADKMKCHPNTIAAKWKRVPKADRNEIELSLVRILYEHKKIHKSKLNKAKRLLGIL